MKWSYNLVRFSEGDITPIEWFVLLELTPEPSIEVEARPGEREMEWVNIQLKYASKKYHLNRGKKKEPKQIKK